MTALIRKNSWQHCIALCLLLGCDQHGSIISPESPQQGTINQEGESHNTPLHQAVLQGDVTAVQAHLKTIDVNTPDNERNTALHLAVLQNNLALVKILVEAEASISVKNTIAITPLQLAIQKEDPQIIEALGAVPSNIVAQRGGTTGRGMSLIQLLFRWNYESIGKKRILEYIPMKDKGHLRETCVEIGWMLLHKDAFHLSLTADRLQHIQLQDYPRLYPHIQHANGITFQPVPADAVVQNVGDLQRIVGDSRFAIKSVVFKGGLENLKEVCKSLPQNIQAIEVGADIPPEETVDLSQYEQLKIVKIKELHSNIILPKGIAVLYSDTKQLIEATTKDSKHHYDDVDISVLKQPETQLQKIEHPVLKQLEAQLQKIEHPVLKQSETQLQKIEHPVLKQPETQPQKIEHSGNLVDADEKHASADPFVGVQRIPLGAIDVGNYLAEGAFGKVYQGSWGERQVALKEIDVMRAALGLKIHPEDVKELIQWEVSRLATTNHPNLVQFYGVYQDGNKDHTYLVMELCEGGTLEGALKKGNVPWPKRWQWVLQISEGLAYLHKEGILHRDLKAENVLLDRYGRAKLADLGVARVDDLLEKNEVKVVAEGFHDFRFIAPENIGNKTLSSKATDIYALGLVFWQVASRKEPRGLKQFLAFGPSSWVTGANIEREPIPQDCPASFKQLILDCWQTDPTKRPSAEAIVDKLRVLGTEFNPKYHALVKACEGLEKIIHPKRKESLTYIAPYVTARKVEELIENYWDKWEPPTEKKEGPNPPLELEQIFWNFIKEPNCSTLLLLGEAGLGKTLTTYIWADKLMQQWWSYIKEPSIERPPYLPIFIRPTLSNWTHAALEGAFLSELKRYELQDTPVLVFIDGYDELMDKLPVNLVEHLGLSKYLNAKLIVTCRPKTADLKDLYERFNFSGQLKMYHFLPFSIDQLLEYLKKQLFWGAETEAEYRRTLQNSSSVREVLRTPFVLYLLKKSWRTLSQEPFDQLTRWKIYEGFVKHSITTQCSLLAPQLQDTLAKGYSNLIDSFQAFAGDIAFRACQNKSTIFNLQEAVSKLSYPWVRLEELVAQDARGQFKKRQEGLSKANEKEKLQKQRHTLLSEEDFIVVMQKRRQQLETDLPLKIRNDGYEFSHKSLFEYFVAKRLFQLHELDESMLLTARLADSNSEALLFFYEGWKEEEGKKLTAPSIIEGPGKENSKKALAPIGILLHSAGRVLRNRASYKEALECYFQALTTFEEAFSEVHHYSDYFELKLSLYDDIILILKDQGKNAEALEYTLRASEIKKNMYGEDHLHIAGAYDRIGTLLNTQEEPEKAMEYYLKALDIRENLHGRKHLDVASSYDHIGIALMKQEKHEEAMKYHLQALAMRKNLHSKESLDIALSYNNIAIVLMKQGKHKEAMEYHLQALIIRENLHGKEHPQVADSYINIGDVLEKQRKYKEALEYFRKALVIRERVYGKKHQSVSASYMQIGTVLNKQGNYAEAIEYSQQALVISEQIHGESHSDIAKACCTVGLVLGEQGKYAEALEYFLKASAISEQVYRKWHPNVARYYNIVGGTLAAQGRYTQALEYFMKALAVFEQAYGKVHPNVAGSYNKIGNVLQDQVKYEEAIEWHTKALSIYEQVYGQDHPQVASSYSNIGIVLHAQGKYEEALEYYFKALPIDEKAHGKDYPYLWVSYNNIGKVLNTQGKYKEALEYHFKALPIGEQVHGKDHSNVATSYHNIGLVLDNQGKHEEALEYYLKSLAIREKVLSKDHPKVADSYNDIGKVLNTQGKYEEALEYYFRSLAVRERVYGKDHPQVATSYNNIGKVLLTQGKYNEALGRYFEALAICEKLYGKEHLKVADSYNGIGDILKKQDRYEEALEYYLKALAVFEKLYGKEHPEVADSYSDIANILEKQSRYKEALEYYLKALAIREDANSCDSVGLILRIQGKYEEALRYYLKALSIYEKIFGKEHRRIANYHNNIGIALEEQGKYEEALEYYLKALAIYEKRSGKGDTNVANSYYMIGYVLETQVKYKEALEYYLKSLGIGEQAYGKGHPYIASLCNNIGVLLKKQGKCQEALEYYHKALEIYQQVNGKDGSNTIRCVRNISSIAYQVGDLSTVISCYEELNEKHNLACMYHVKALQEKDQGQEKEYLEYLDKARATFEAIFSSLGKEALEANVCTEYAMFLLKYHNKNNKEEYEKIQCLLVQAIGQDDSSRLVYNKLERDTAVKPLQDLINEQNEVNIKPRTLACYLLITLYHMHFEKAYMDTIFEQFMTYAASLKSQAEVNIAEYLLNNLMELRLQ
jgi:tetratricopeptide (TPR) repeat protein/serine/threonine protein kinase